MLTKSLKEICQAAMAIGQGLDLSDCQYGETTNDKFFLDRPTNYYFFLAGFVRSEKLRYLKYVIPSVREGGKIHYYTLGRTDEEKVLVRDAQHIAEKINREVEIKAIRKCGSFSPRVYRLVMDMVV